VFSRPGGDTSFVGWKNATEVRVDKQLIAEQDPGVFFGADVLLSTLEVSPEAVVAAQRIARKGGCMTVLNPAPPLETPGY
jgi:sugar/nucleoside kinase (ribokinase family)